MNWRLTLGLSEDRDFPRPKIPRATFSPNGRYGPALAQLERLLAKPSTKRAFDDYWARCVASGSTLPAATKQDAWPRWLGDIRWICVMEAEGARLWSEGPEDYQRTLRAYRKTSEIDARRIKSALAELRRFDTKHPYLLRISLQRALQDFLADEKIQRIKRPNQNAVKGYEWQTISGPTVRDHQFQFINNMSLPLLDAMLSAWEREIDFMFGRWPANWREFGALRFDSELTPKAAAKLNVGQLGLLARLSSRLRDFTAGFGILTYSTGQPLSKHGSPCWDVVAEFLNCALRLDEPMTGETAGRVWRSFAAKHRVTTQAWPKPAKKEPQLQKK